MLKQVWNHKISPAPLFLLCIMYPLVIPVGQIITWYRTAPISIFQHQRCSKCHLRPSFTILPLCWPQNSLGMLSRWHISRDKGTWTCSEHVLRNWMAMINICLSTVDHMTTCACERWLLWSTVIKNYDQLFIQKLNKLKLVNKLVVLPPNGK